MINVGNIYGRIVSDCLHVTAVCVQGVMHAHIQPFVGKLRSILLQAYKLHSNVTLASLLHLKIYNFI